MSRVEWMSWVVILGFSGCLTAEARAQGSPAESPAPPILFLGEPLKPQGLDSLWPDPPAQRAEPEWTTTPPSSPGEQVRLAHSFPAEKPVVVISSLADYKRLTSWPYQVSPEEAIRQLVWDRRAFTVPPNTIGRFVRTERLGDWGRGTTWCLVEVETGPDLYGTPTTRRGWVDPFAVATKVR